MSEHEANRGTEEQGAYNRLLQQLIHDLTSTGQNRPWIDPGEGDAEDDEPKTAAEAKVVWQGARITALEINLEQVLRNYQHRLEEIRQLERTLENTRKDLGEVHRELVEERAAHARTKEAAKQHLQ